MAYVTYIIPLHKFDKTVESLLPNALKSLNEQDDKDFSVIIVGPEAVLEKAKEINTDLTDITKYVSNENTDVFIQINKGVENCDTPYFAVLEYDDELTPIWTRNAKLYSQRNDASVLLPLTEIYSAGAAVSFGNELAWDVSFAEEDHIGYINSEMLNTFMDFTASGAFIKVEDFNTIGELKSSLKIAAWYEFLLRCCYKNKTVYVVPKLGYKHAIDTPESYSTLSKETITQEEGAWLIKIAKQEYFFKNDRNKKFGE